MSGDIRVQWNGWDCRVRFSKYVETDTPAIFLADWHTGEPICTASVNLHYPDTILEPGQIAIKTYGGNEGVDVALQQAGVLGKELRRVESGFVEVPVYELLKS